MWHNSSLRAKASLRSAGLGPRRLPLPAPEQRAILRRIALTRHIPRTITSRSRLEAELTGAHRRGWSHEHREFTDATACCGAAILDHTGQPVAAISAAGPADRMERALDRIAPIVASTAEAISRRLGYAQPPSVR